MYQMICEGLFKWTKMFFEVIPGEYPNLYQLHFLFNNQQKIFINVSQFFKCLQDVETEWRGIWLICQFFSKLFDVFFCQ